ncbi:hypothetical protein PS467_14865 [Streptomyces luomodiensis]|uniref:Uncharacterized protein n=1 Tax=Streptomyces luomodiensis TaxID=3026192 RepID=A0ABY9UXD5_9ACTN|nr:hypothetical protein [Streptomyces sp. SCA4-21]WNE96524.1 hypothetical protein PS467_14865 [Streptomyces sp. SCA4-21]
MSIPGETPNPYGQPQPHQPPQPPQQSPPQSPYGQPQPHQAQPLQHNPYAQPTMPSVPLGGYGPMGTPPGAPPTGSGGGRKGWPWALGGAVVASAVWAGVLFATGGFDGEAKADLAGYRYTNNLCTATDAQTIEDAGYQQEDGSANPQHSSSEDPALDSMTCNIDFEPNDADSDDYSSVWLYTTASLHKKTDPAPEFEAQYRAYEEQKTSSYSYKVSPVNGLGAEAYVVTQVSKSGSDTGAYVILGVRDGWMTYQSTWSEYLSSSSSATAKTPEEATAMLKKSARATLEKMKE